LKGKGEEKERREKGYFKRRGTRFNYYNQRKEGGVGPYNLLRGPFYCSLFLLLGEPLLHTKRRGRGEGKKNLCAEKIP